MEIITALQLDLINTAGRTLLGVDGPALKTPAGTRAGDQSDDDLAFSRHRDEKHRAVRILLDYLAETVPNRQVWLIGDRYSPDEKLKLLLLRRVSLFANHPQFAVAVLSPSHGANSLFYEGPSVTEIMDKEKEQLHTVIVEGQTQGVFIGSVKPDRLADVIMGAHWLLIYRWRASGFSFDVNRESNRTIKDFLTLLKALK